MTAWSLNPKNQPVDDLPLLAKSLKTLWSKMRLLWHTTSLVASTKFPCVVPPKRQVDKKANKKESLIFVVS